MVEETGYTYEDAARLCGVSAETIRKRASRGAIRKGRRTNSGRPTVLLTEEELQAIRGDRSSSPDNRTYTPLRPDGRPDGQPDEPAELVALLRDQLAQAEARAERFEARELESRAAAERQTRELTAALLRTAIAETEARALRESLAEARRPAWRRWLGLRQP